MNANEDFRNDAFLPEDDAVTGPPPADDLDELLRAWHDRNAARAAAGRDRLLRALAKTERADQTPATWTIESNDVAPANSRPFDRTNNRVPGPHMLRPTRAIGSLRKLLNNRYSPAAAAAILLAALAGLLAPNPFGPARDKTFAGTVMVPNGGRLDARDAAGRLIGPCPLQHTDVDVSVLGRFARVTVQQTYQNPYDEKIEAVYTFPLSHRGAVDRMTMTIGDRVVIGEVHERNQARAIYQAARRQGRVASLLEQERPNIFTQSVANIEPGAEVLIEISYVEILEETDGLFSFEFPMVVAPRYIPGSPLPMSDAGPSPFQPRHGVIELGPSALSTYDANDTDPDAPELDPTRLRALMNAAKPIEWPDDPNENPSTAPSLLHRFEAKYADGSVDFGALYADGTGEIDGRWFYTDLNGSPESGTGTGFSQNTTQVPDAARITPAPVPPEIRAGHDISVNVDIDTAGPGIYEVTSYLHDVQSYQEQVRTDGLASKMNLSLTNTAEIPNRDFVLTWRQTADTITEQVFTHTGEQGGFFTLVLNPPERVVEDQIVPRELIFVLDTSGSMSGFPIEKAKETMALAIDSLRAEDTFNLITFAGDTHILWDRPRPADAQSLAEAQAFLESRQGRGGTEMMSAINAALVRPADDYTELTPRELADLPADGREVDIQVPARNTDVILQDGVAPGVIDLPLPNGNKIRANVSFWSLDTDYFNRPAEETIYRLTGRWNTVDGDRLFEVDSATTTDKLETRPVRIVCFMTDGQVGNDQFIIDAVQQNAHTTRVFSFGIGDSPNRYLLDNMARAGRGAADYVLLDRDAAPIVQQFNERILSPVLTDIRLEFSEGLEVTDRVPAEIPDLHDRRPIIVHGRFENPGAGTLTITGMTGVGPYERTVKLDLTAKTEQRDALPVLWARAKVDDLMNRDLAAAQSGNFPADLRQQIVDLGETYSIMTQFTSFVAVDHLSVSVEGEPRLIPVPVELPEGQDYESTFGKDVLDASNQLLIEIQPAERQLQLVEQYGPAEARELLQLVGQIPALVTEERFDEALTAVDRVQTIDGDQAWADAMRDGIEEKRAAAQPLDQASAAGSAPATNPNDEQVFTIPLKHRDAYDIAFEIEDMLQDADGKSPRLDEGKDARTLMVQARPEQRERIRELVRMYDVPNGDTQEIASESKASAKQAEIASRESDRIARSDDSKAHTVEQLMDQAAKLGKEGRYEDAAQVLDEVQAIDPANERAAWMNETLKDTEVHASNRAAVSERHSQSQGSDSVDVPDIDGDGIHEKLIAGGLASPRNRFQAGAAYLLFDHSGESDAGVPILSTLPPISDGPATKTRTSTFNVEDLLHRVPEYRGRQVNLDEIGTDQDAVPGQRFVAESTTNHTNREGQDVQLGWVGGGGQHASAPNPAADKIGTTAWQNLSLGYQSQYGSNGRVNINSADGRTLAAVSERNPGVFDRTAEVLGRPVEPTTPVAQGRSDALLIPSGSPGGFGGLGQGDFGSESASGIKDADGRKWMPADTNGDEHPDVYVEINGATAGAVAHRYPGDFLQSTDENAPDIDNGLVIAVDSTVPADEVVRRFLQSVPKSELGGRSFEPEIAAKRTMTGEDTGPEATRQVRQKLKESAAEIKSDGVGFETAIDNLRHQTGLNIVVGWTALESAGIERDAEVNLKLQNVTLEKSLDLLLDHTGGGETELAWTVRDGCVLISTKQDIDRMKPTPRAAAAAGRPARPESARSISPDQLALHLAALTTAGRFDEAVGLARWLAANAPKYEIGAQMLEVFTKDGLTDDDRAEQVARLGRQAAERIKAMARTNRTLVRKLDPRLLPFAFARVPAADAASDVTMHDGRILVSVLIADKKPATLDTLKDAGLKIDDVTESANVAVGSITPENLAKLALLDSVRRVSPL